MLIVKILTAFGQQGLSLTCPGPGVGVCLQQQLRLFPCSVTHVANSYKADVAIPFICCSQVVCLKQTFHRKGLIFYLFSFKSSYFHSDSST